METSWQSIAVAAGIGALVTLMGNIIFSFLQQKQQIEKEKNIRWWERKVEAYTRIIKALYELVNYYNLIYSNAIGESDLSNLTREKLNKEINRYLKDIEQATSIGTFIISSDAENVLMDFARQRDEFWDSERAFEEVMESNYELAKNCLAAMKVFAKSDLAVQ